MPDPGGTVANGASWGRRFLLDDSSSTTISVTARTHIVGDVAGVFVR
jgi:hypothetical protein